MRAYRRVAGLVFSGAYGLAACGGGGSTSTQAVAPADTTPPLITLDAPLDGSLTNQAEQTLLPAYAGIQSALS